MWLKAQQDGKDIKLKDIAQKLGEPENTIRKWKCTDKWEEKKNVPKKKGAPKGNKNAKGNKGGAPKGSQNHLKHGGYSEVYWDTLTEEEKSLITDMDVDEEFVLIDQIKVCTIRERRLMKALARFEIKEGKYAPDGFAVTSISVRENKRAFEPTEEGKAEKVQYEIKRAERIAKDEIMPGRNQTIDTYSEANYNYIIRLQAELTRVQRQKAQCITSLMLLHEKRGDADGDKAVISAWVDAVTGGGNNG